MIALLISLALAAPGGTIIRDGGGKTIPATDGGWAPPVMQIPFTQTGALIAEDANTVAHVYWDGSQLVDTKANAWTMTGTVPQNVDSPLYPTGFSGSSKKGAGPLGLTNYYSLPGNTLPASLASGFTICFVFEPDDSALANGFLFLSGIVGTSGWYSYFSPTLSRLAFTGGTCSMSVGSGVIVTGAAGNVACGGRNGSTGYFKINGGTTVSDATCSDTWCTACSTYIGTDTSTSIFNGKVYEVYLTSTPYNETTVAAIEARVLGQYATDASGAATTPLTVTRSSVATYEQPAGTIWTAAPSVIRVNASGALIEPSATNYALNSSTNPKTSEASASLPTGAAIAWHAGTGTLTIAAGTATLSGLTNCTATPVGTPCKFTVTVAGTVLITTTAGTTRVQVETGVVPTSYIATTTTSVVRQADSVTFASPYATAPTTVCVDMTASIPTDCSLAMDCGLLSTTASGLNWILAYKPQQSDGKTLAMSANASGTTATWASPDALPHRLSFSFLNVGLTSNRSAKISVDGAVIGGIATGQWTGYTTSFSLGSTLADLTRRHAWASYKNVRLYDTSCVKARP